ncbi:hypothetical protein SAMN05877809_1017 [Rhodobacter sp. JA431]|uniref:hypothetical protein n=1 Tax=Rhodobacter sp. JA431 TaxID=570013 RepID=UPI000BCC04AD|nr:hypothetical protein [Rhodobacter sp. JA431]SOB89439.1 hypothetical protein SAMN05877809_1017 [Rhodobacter sp. JA431]
MDFIDTLDPARSHLLFGAVAFAFIAPLQAQASTLADVIARIESMGPAPLMAVMANVAQNTAQALFSPRLLSPGDNVVVGFDAEEEEVFATAGATGLEISQTQAASIATGLSAGLYPIGSALYELPPAGQLALWEEARDGSALAAAQSQTWSRIDGSIQTVLTTELQRNILADVVAVAQPPAWDWTESDFGILAATALGAVNTGEIITRIDVAWDADLDRPDLGIRSALLETGASIDLVQTQTNTTAAQSLQLTRLGSTPDAAALLLNLASNNSEVIARVDTRVYNIAAGINGAITTVIGAVNAGQVGER